MHLLCPCARKKNPERKEKKEKKKERDRERQPARSGAAHLFRWQFADKDERDGSESERKADHERDDAGAGEDEPVVVDRPTEHSCGERQEREREDQEGASSYSLQWRTIKRGIGCQLLVVVVGGAREPTRRSYVDQEDGWEGHDQVDCRPGGDHRRLSLRLP